LLFFEKRYNFDIRINNEVVGVDFKKKLVKVKILKDNTFYEEVVY
jgi:hypothetical protein